MHKETVNAAIAAPDTKALENFTISAPPDPKLHLMHVGTGEAGRQLAGQGAQIRQTILQASSKESRGERGKSSLSVP